MITYKRTWDPECLEKIIMNTVLLVCVFRLFVFVVVLRINAGMSLYIEYMHS